MGADRHPHLPGSKHTMLPGGKGLKRWKPVRCPCGRAPKHPESWAAHACGGTVQIDALGCSPSEERAIGGELLVILLLSLVNGVFAGAEIAIVSLRRSRLQELVAAG